MSELRSFRVTMRDGFTTVLRLRPETAARDYPGAVELKVEQPEVKKPVRRRTSRKPAGGESK